MPISSSNAKLTNMTDFEIRVRNAIEKFSKMNLDLQD